MPSTLAELSNVIRSIEDFGSETTMNQLTKTTKWSLASNFKLLSVLANPIRVEVLTHLAFSEKCVADISMELELDQSTVSHALRKLFEVELVERKIIKKNHIYRLSPAIKATGLDNHLQLEVVTDQMRIFFHFAKT